jgi:hypothetical protein
LLAARVQFPGWSVGDQSKGGFSAQGNAGERDLLITWGSSVLALIEAGICDRPLTQDVMKAGPRMSFPEAAWVRQSKQGSSFTSRLPPSDTDRAAAAACRPRCRPHTVRAHLPGCARRPVVRGALDGDRGRRQQLRDLHRADPFAGERPAEVSGGVQLTRVSPPVGPVSEMHVEREIGHHIGMCRAAGAANRRGGHRHQRRLVHIGGHHQRVATFVHRGGLCQYHHAVGHKGILGKVWFSSPMASSTPRGVMR